MPITLNRTTFTTSRLLEYFDEDELTMQLGTGRARWPLALARELIDNALDACEAAGTPPAITVTVEPDALTIADNGPGLPLATIEGALDYSVRVSDKHGYISPTRGRLGNALKCVFVAPFVASSDRHGRVIVATDGARHTVDIGLDQVRQEPRISRETVADPTVQTGTAITLVWPDLASSQRGHEGADLYRALGELVEHYRLFNPHATFRLRAPSGEDARCGGTLGAPFRRWRPSDPTSPHWYTPARLGELIRAYLRVDQEADRARPLREFLEEFDGLARTDKRRDVLLQAGLSGRTLRDLLAGGDLDAGTVARLLAAMQHATRPVKPAALGVLGEAWLREALTRDHGAAPASVRYKKVTGYADGLPFVLEVASGARDDDGGRRVAVGLNHSPREPHALGNTLHAALADARLDSTDSATLVISLVCPHLDYLDRAKTVAALPPEIRGALSEAVGKVTQVWRDLARQKNREHRLARQVRDRLLKGRRAAEWTIKEAAYLVMAEAYRLASDDGALPANARQVMYAARGDVLRLTGGKLWSTSAYFTQTLLPDYLAEHPDETEDWDVTFDARGHLTEPHTGRGFGLGTLEVRDYIHGWGPGRPAAPALSLNRPFLTSGPDGRYRHVLFIEKEGFMPLLERARLAERYDLAIMSTKGQSVTAARRLVDDLSRRGVTILVAHDFDKSGFEIVDNLRRDTRRYTYDRDPRVVDIGLRLADVEAMGLQSEPVEYKQDKDPRVNLAECGATPEECAFLVRGRGPYARGGYHGARVELNAMTARQFLDWLEGKLAEHGVAKVVPEPETLGATYEQVRRWAAVEEVARRAMAEQDATKITVPENLTDRVRSQLASEPGLSWDEAVALVAREDHEAA